MKRKLISAIVCGLLLASFAGCGDRKAPADSGDTPMMGEDGADAQTPADTGDLSAPGEEGSDAQVPADGDDGQEAFSLMITDSYTFTDPEGLAFDQRYVLTGDASSKLLSDIINAGYEVTAMYDIVYEREGKAAGEYQYFVTPDEENAKALEEFYASQGQTVTREGNLLYAFVDGEVLQANIMTFSSMNLMSGETVRDYVDFMIGSYGLTE